MKKVLVVSALALVTSLASAAGMGGMGGGMGGSTGGTGGMNGGSGMMGPNASRAMGQPMMNRDMMQEMGSMQQQMRDNMRRMSQLMDGRTLDQKQMRDMASVMGNMSQSMNDMAGSMEGGKGLSDEQRQRLQSKMQETNRIMQRLESGARGSTEGGQ